MSSLSRLVAFTIFFVVAPGIAGARVCAPAPCPPPTHFIAELHGGSTTYGGGGPVLSALFGVGGKLRGFPPIFYLVGEASYSASRESGGLPTTGIGYRDERSAFDLLAGLRIYLPIYGPVRLFGEAAIGTSHVNADFSRDGHPTLVADDWTVLTRLGAGLQVRVFHTLSVGARFNATIVDEGLESYNEALRNAGTSGTMRTMLTASVTWHF